MTTTALRRGIPRINPSNSRARNASRTGIRLTPHQWIPLRFEWRRTGNTVSYVLNGQLRSVQIDRESADIYALAVGNMDGLRKDGQSVYGGTPEVRYRNLRCGRL